MTKRTHAAGGPDRFPDAPSQIRALPRDPRGFPIPAFVGWLNGKRDFRVIMTDTVDKHAQGRLCWICGRKLHWLATFVIGPMCAVNRISSEPGSHLDCARFAARACPFLTEPQAVRNKRELAGLEDRSPGVPIARNPGVTLLWTCRNWSRGPEGLFHLGDASRVEWYAQGRIATRLEIESSIATGLPHLAELAREDGPEAERELAAMLERARTLLPAA